MSRDVLTAYFDNELIVRYDSTPHFPGLSTFPHHKHLPNTVIAADKPDIVEALQEASTIARRQA